MKCIRAVRVFVLGVVILGGLAPGRAQAQAAAPADQQLREAQAEVERLKKELDAMRAQYDARLPALEQKLTTLAAARGRAHRGRPRAASCAGVRPAPPAGAEGLQPGHRRHRQLPRRAGHNPNSDQPTLDLDEVEASFQAVVDPYARADFFLSAGPDGLDIEEGFVTFNTLPGGLLLKVGQDAGAVRQGQHHAHPCAALDGSAARDAEPGRRRRGASPSPACRCPSCSPEPVVFLESTGEAYYGTRTCSSATSDRSSPTWARMRAYRDLTEGTNIDLGGSFAYGPSAATALQPVPLDAASTRLIGLRRDVPLSAAAPRHLPRFMARTELVWSQPRHGGDGGQTAFGDVCAAATTSSPAAGMPGARYDRSGRAWDASLVDTGGAVLPHLLAERVQSGARPVPPDQLRRRRGWRTNSCSSSCSRSVRTAPTSSEEAAQWSLVDRVSSQSIGFVIAVVGAGAVAAPRRRSRRCRKS